MKKPCRENQTNRYIVPAFARGLKLMEFLSRSPEGLSMSEMGDLGIPPATLFRMLTTLVNSGYAVLEKSGEYRLNGKLLSMAYRAVENTSLTTVADGPMRELRDRTGESVMPAVLHRCLYARDVRNLFLGGRCLSLTHVAFSCVRVMRTLGMPGEVAGMAAALCIRHGCGPRDIYREHLEELKEAMRRGIPIEPPCGYMPGNEVAYHFMRPVGTFGNPGEDCW